MNPQKKRRSLNPLQQLGDVEKDENETKQGPSQENNTKKGEGHAKFP